MTSRTTSRTTTLKQSQGSAGTRILALGAARGDRVVPNDELVGPIESSDEWIRQRTGIETRTRASEGVLALDLAVEASREAIAASGIAIAPVGPLTTSTCCKLKESRVYAPMSRTPSMKRLLRELKPRIVKF